MLIGFVGFIGVLVLIVLVISIIVLFIVYVRPIRDKNSLSVKDDISDASDSIVNAINIKGNRQISLLTQLTQSVDVNILPLNSQVESQLEILFTAAINASQPLTVDLNNPSSLQPVMEAALTFAANNLQYDVLSTQNGVWTVDLSIATINAIETAFENALGSTIVTVNLNTSPVTVTLDAASLLALETTNVNVLGQPISVTVTNPTSNTVTIDNASVAAIATAIAGQNLNVNVLGQPLSITGSINLGDVSALTNWLAANDLSIDDSAIIAAINGISTDDITDDDVTLVVTPKIDVGCAISGLQWHTFWERRYTELGVLVSSTQYWSDGVSLATIIPPGLSKNTCRTVDGVCVAFSGNTTETLGLAAGTYGKLKTIFDHGGGVVRYSFNGTDPTNDTFPEANNRMVLNLKGVDLSQLRFRGTATNSDYTVCYEITI